MLLKNKSICFGAGKIILAISIVLWFMVLGKNSITQKLYSFQNGKCRIPQEELDNKVAAYKLENSYIGIMGKV
jgi:ferrous iron transport protein B